MSLDHAAIRRAYPNVVTINDGTGATDKNGDSIFLDPSLVNKARSEIDIEISSNKYKLDRKA